MNRAILQETRQGSRLPLLGAVVGTVLAAVVWAALVLSASAEAAGAGESASVTRGVSGLDLVTVSREQTADGSSASLSPQPGSAVLLVLPLGGWALGHWRASASPPPARG